MVKTEAYYLYRTELKGKILEVAETLFFARGIRAVKMDDISHQLGISKRTLYEVYPNKEELVCECLLVSIKKTKDKLRVLAENGANAIDIIMEFFRMKIHEFSVVSPAFYEDITYYDKVVKTLEDYREKNFEASVQFFVRGQQEGYFIPDVDFELSRHLANYLTDIISKEQLFKRYSPNEIMRTLVLCFVRGFCTEKGLKVMDAYLNE